MICWAAGRLPSGFLSSRSAVSALVNEEMGGLVSLMLLGFGCEDYGIKGPAVHRPFCLLVVDVMTGSWLLCLGSAAHLGGAGRPPGCAAFLGLNSKAQIDGWSARSDDAGGVGDDGRAG
jgi:hypothetical protein